MSGFPLNAVFDYANLGACAPAPAPGCAPCGSSDPCGTAGNGFGPFVQGANPFNAVAVGALQPFRAVAVTTGGVMYAGNDVPEQQFTQLGIIGAGGVNGALVSVFWGGPVTNNITGSGGWNWTLGQPVYLGLNGLLTQTRPLPEDGFARIVGMPLSSNTILVNPPAAGDVGYFNPTGLTVATGVATANCNGSNWAAGTINGNVSLAIIGGPVEGQAISVAITAAGANRTVTLSNTDFIIPTSSGATSPITVNAGTETVIGLRWSVAKAKWRIVAIVAGY